MLPDDCMGQHNCKGIRIVCKQFHESDVYIEIDMKSSIRSKLYNEYSSITNVTEHLYSFENMFSL